MEYKIQYIKNENIKIDYDKIFKNLKKDLDKIEKTTNKSELKILNYIIEKHIYQINKIY